MLTILALAAGLFGAPASDDALAPALARTSTSFTCATVQRSISVARAPHGDMVEFVAVNQKRLSAAAFAQAKGMLAVMDRVDEVRPQCGQGPDRILIKGRSGTRKRSMMLFFGPANEVAVREVG